MLLIARSPLNLIQRWIASVSKSMRQNKIVPDMVDTPCDEMVHITYPSGTTVNLGNDLKPRIVSCLPETVKWKAKPRGMYFFCMLDPDAPSREKPTCRNWNHWMVGNIPGGDIEEGETLAEYIGAAPPKGKGMHRYVFLVFQQPSALTFGGKRLLNNSVVGRPNFNLKRFVSIYNLGDPVAANFFQAEYDDYVDVIMARLKKC